MKNLIIILLFLSFLSGCQTMQENFSLKKKDNSDEFLVEKKNPLVMPPNFENLPNPENVKIQENKINDEFENIINTKNEKNVTEKKKKTTIEKSVLDKIN